MASKRKPKDARDLSDYISLVQVAKDSRVTNTAIHLWLKREMRHRYPYYWLIGKKAFIRLDVAALYTTPRVTSRPKGWRTWKQLAAELDGKGKQFFRDQEEAGLLRVERFRGNVYIHPEDAAWLVQAYRELLPPRGALLLTDFARRLGRTPRAVASWAARNGVSTPFYRHPTTGHPVRYLSPADADRYAQLVEERGDRHKPKAKHVETASSQRHPNSRRRQPVLQEAA